MTRRLNRDYADSLICLLGRLHKISWGKGHITAIKDIYKTLPALSQDVITSILPSEFPYEDERFGLGTYLEEPNPVGIIDFTEEWKKVRPRLKNPLADEMHTDSSQSARDREWMEWMETQNKPTTKFIIRQEYFDLLSQMDQAQTNRNSNKRWVICAHPGIGKTSFCLFLLLEYFSRRLPVMVNIYGLTIAFDGRGRRHYNLQFGRNLNGAIYLVDGSGVPPTVGHTVVQICSPNATCDGWWSQYQGDWEMLVMRAWSRRELCSASLYSMESFLSNDYRVSDLYDELGPIPASIRKRALGLPVPGWSRRAIKERVPSIKPESFEDLAKDGSDSAWCLLNCRKDENGRRYPLLSIVSPSITREIASHLHRQFKERQRNDIRQLLASKPSTRLLGEMIFQHPLLVNRAYYSRV